MKKICYITTVPGTIKAFILPFIEYALEHTEWEFYLVCDINNDFRDIVPNNVTYIPIKMKRGVNLSGILSTLKMIKLFKKERFDLIQYSTPNASFYASIAGKIAGIPQRLYCQWGIAYVGFSGIKRNIFKKIEKIVCKCSTVVEPDSISNLKFSISEKLYSANKGHVIWNGSASGVKLSKFDISKKNKFRKNIRNKYNIPDNAFVYIFVGRITKDKGINELLASYRKICSLDTYLFLVGSDESDDSVNKDNYDWAKLNSHVIFTGITSEVEQYMAASDCYVLPSYREGFGLSVIEAQAMGVPVIVSNIPGPIDAVEDEVTGLIVQKADISSLIEAMGKIRTLNINEMGKKGHDFVVENYDQEILFSKILADRESILDNKI